MADFKDILLHIFSQTEGLKNLPDVKSVAELDDSYKKALQYAFGDNQTSSTQANLQSIFDGLAGADEKGYFFEAKELSLENFNFPKKDNLQTNTDEVFRKFKNDFEQIKNFEGKAFAETCLALLEKYFCYVPCGIEGLEEVSVYDYIKSVAGFMVCLQNTEIDQEKPFLLIGGDISGIQAFIYDIISTDASKNLKGRSFYLQLLVDSVIRKILNTLGLFSGNIIYASGGGFYILAPNTEPTINKLENLEKEISQKIFDTHKTAFSLVIAWVEIEKDIILKHKLIVNPDVKKEDQKTIFDTLIQQINRKQKQKFKHQILNNFDSFFGDKGIEVGGNQERDAITGEEFEEKEQKFPVDKDDPSREGKIKKTTKEQIELGKELKDFEFLVSSDSPISITGKANFYNPCELGTHYCFLSLEELGQLDLGNNQLTIQSINKIENHLIACYPNSTHTYIFNFYGGNDYPIFELINENGKFKKDMPKTFSELAGQKESERTYQPDWQEPSYKRLGVLRMDVDGLGAVFSGKELGNFTKYSVLSRSLDYFFKGYLNEIWRNNHNFKENTQIIYSGGDDLFMVGRWDILIEFAEQIRQDFEKWTCYNEKLGISGGIATVPPKYPIAKAAKQSEEFEKPSKGHTYLYIEKNAICFLDDNMPLHWKYEYSIVKDLKKQLQDFVEKTKNNSLLQRIQAFNVQKKIQEEKDLTHSWRWLLAYDFARFRDRIKRENQDQREFINQLKTNIFLDTYNSTKMQSRHTFIELLALAARWAELENRTRKKSEENH
jgi:CRISPR-associated protein Csm1